MTTGCAGQATPEATPTAPAAPASPPPTWLLALGDSLTVGIGAPSPADQGYVAEVLRLLEDEGDMPRLTNLAVSGETTASMIAGGQLAGAVQFLEAHADEPGIVLLSIAGNDVARLYVPCSVGTVEDCRAAAGEVIPAASGRLATILRTLRDAAGAETRLVVLTYYNPLHQPRCPLHQYEARAEAVIRGGPPLDLDRPLNPAIEELAASIEAATADLADLDARHLVADCLHPNAAGHALIGERVFEALRD